MTFNNNNEDFNLNKFLADHYEFCSTHNIELGQELEEIVVKSVNQELTTLEVDLELELAAEMLATSTPLSHPGEGLAEIENHTNDKYITMYFNPNYPHDQLLKTYLAGSGKGDAVDLLKHSYAREALLDRARKNLWYKMRTPVELLRAL